VLVAKKFSRWLPIADQCHVGRPDRQRLGYAAYFVLIEQAGETKVSYHYLPHQNAFHAADCRVLRSAFSGTSVPVRGTAWTTDARETASAIRFYREQGVAAVEMEAAALYAFGQARGQPVVCFAHVTNQMAVVEGDFEKGRDNGSHDALEVIGATARAWLAADDQPNRKPR
jgi:uridine phosphorylase